MHSRLPAFARLLVIFAVLVGAALAGGAHADARGIHTVHRVQWPSSPTTTSTPRTPVTSLKMLNYYPANAGWSKMWTSYNHAQVDADMTGIASLGANSVRIVLQPYALGWPTPSATGLAEIRDVVDTASAHGLSVQFTLFDWWGEYARVTDSAAWATAVLSPYANDPRVVLVELQNEVDMTRSDVISWATSMLGTLQKVAPSIPRTLSVAGSASPSMVQKLFTTFGPTVLDVVDVHLYGTWDQEQGQLNAAKAAAQGRPIFVGEGGISSGTTPSNGTDQYQAARYWALLELIRANGVAQFAPWIYSDFTAAGYPHSPVDSGAYFGLRRADGSWKTAAGVVRFMFTGAPLPAGTDLYLDGGFEHENATANADRQLGAWSVFDGADAAAAGVAAGAGPDGSSAGYLSRTGGTNSAVPALTQSFPRVGSNRVTVSADVRLDAGTGGTRLAVAWFTGNVYLGQTESTLASNGTSGWQRLTVSSTPPANATSFQVALKSSANSGTAYFDNVVVTTS